MRMTEYFLPTVKEVPSDAEVISHKLMIRAGMIRKIASGIYTYLPMGLKVLRKVENIIREEMNRAGAHEILMPSVQPKELWEESGRWSFYGKELLRFKDRIGREFCYGPTHEEVVTDLVRNHVKSYREMPLNLYQIQTKFRDEIRPRFGVMRSREFIMKDGYSFDIDESSAEKAYMKMYTAYCNIFSRCGLDFRAVEADTGAIGGSFSHEFMVMADSGEDLIFLCDKCKYAANKEKAEVGNIFNANIPETLKELEKVKTSGKKSIEDVAAFLGMPVTKIAKTLVYLVDSSLYMLIIRGDRDANEIKLKNALNAQEIRLATDEEIQTGFNIPVGFMGPYGLNNIQLVADISLKGLSNFVTGANESDYHYLNANFERDIKVNSFLDISDAKDGDPCPRCLGGSLYSKRGIEVGHIFKLGTKYSKAMNALYLDSKGDKPLIIMGCYGIGVGRTVAAAIEQNFDKDGIVFPDPVAPFKVIVTPTNIQDTEITGTAERIYTKLCSMNIDAIIDDRDERPGVKFKDADLIGIPYRINVGNTLKKEGKLELVTRRNRESSLMPEDEIIKAVAIL